MGKRDLPVRAHSALGASSAYRWMTCPGSVAASDGLPDVESDYAREGTAAHHVLEQSLILDMDPATFLGEVYDGIRVDEDMVEAVQVAWNYVQERKKLPAFRRMLVEERVTLEELQPPRPMFGTCDVVMIFDGFVEVIDYKHGIGILVEVEDNPQAKYYGLGYLLRWIRENAQNNEELPSPVVVTIIQPRIPTTKGLVRSETYKPQELLDWGSGDLLYAAQRTVDEPDTFVPGESQCRFCKAAPGCEALRDYANATAQEEFGVLPAPELLTMEQTAEVLDRASTIKVWVNAVEAYAHQQAEDAGRVPPGFKLVEKRARKVWKEGHDINYVLPQANLLGFRTMEVAKLVTPAQFIKITGIDPVDHYDTVSSGTKLVPEDAPGKRVSPAAEDEFTAIEEK